MREVAVGQFNFTEFKTEPGANGCLFGALPDETPEQYRERLRTMWRSDPCARQHLAVYARYLRRGLLRFSGPMASIAQEAVNKLAFQSQD